MYCNPEEADDPKNKHKEKNPTGKHAYGYSKACVNLLTIAFANTYPKMVFNSCTPGWIDTKLAAPMRAGKTAAEAGMKTTHEGATATLHLLFHPDVKNNGWFYGSDAKRSPLHKYRDPGTEEYKGNDDP